MLFFLLLGLMQKAEDVERLGAELHAAAKTSSSSSASSTKQRQEQQQQQQRDEQQKGERQQQQRIEELMAENQRLWSQYNLGQIEKVASQKKVGSECLSQLLGPSLCAHFYKF